MGGAGGRGGPVRTSDAGGRRGARGGLAGLNRPLPRCAVAFGCPKFALRPIHTGGLGPILVRCWRVLPIAGCMAMVSRIPQRNDS